MWEWTRQNNLRSKETLCRERHHSKNTSWISTKVKFHASLLPWWSGFFAFWNAALSSWKRNLQGFLSPPAVLQGPGCFLSRATLLPPLFSLPRSLSASFKHWCTWSLVLCRNSWHPRARAQWACSAPPCRGRKLVYIRVIPGIASMSAQSTCSRLWGKPVWLCPRKCASCFSFFTPFLISKTDS